MVAVTVVTVVTGDGTQDARGADLQARLTNAGVPFIGPIPQSEFEIESIKDKIRANPLLAGVDANKVKPRILTLTQSTYDGVLYNVEMIKDMLGDTVDNLHFLSAGIVCFARASNDALSSAVRTSAV